MNLYFDNAYNKRLIGSYDNVDDISNAIKKFLDEHKFKSYYTRMWLDNNGHTIIDVGSHTEFFIVDCNIMRFSSCRENLGN